MKRHFSKKARFFSLVAALVLVLTGCGSASKNDSAYSYAPSAPSYDYGYGGDYVVEEEWAEEIEVAEIDADKKADTVGDSSSKRKLIKTASLEVETQDFDNMMDSIKESVDKLGGYIESIYSYNGSAYYSYGYHETRNASLTIRIPEKELNNFLNTVAGIGNVTRRNENVRDVTLAYVDLESNRNSLRVEQERLNELLKQAETVDEIITIEDRLANVRYRLESMESQLRTYDNQIDYSTVSMDVQEVAVLTPVVEKTAWERVSQGFADSVKDVVDGVKEFGIWLIINLPYLVVWAIIIVVAIIVIRALVLSHRANAGVRAQKAEEQRAKREQKRLEQLAKKNAKKAEKAAKAVNPEQPGEQADNK